MQYRKVGNSGLKVSTIRTARGITKLTQEIGTTPAALATAWTLHNPLVASSITGATKPSQVDENLKALDMKITPEIITKIEANLQNSYILLTEFKPPFQKLCATLCIPIIFWI